MKTNKSQNEIHQQETNSYLPAQTPTPIYPHIFTFTNTHTYIHTNAYTTKILIYTPTPPPYAAFYKKASVFMSKSNIDAGWEFYSHIGISRLWSLIHIRFQLP